MKRQTLRVGGALLTYEQPLIMGILNLTTDSFYDGGKYINLDSAMSRVQEIVDEGADILDIGAFSSRPGAHLVSAEQQLSLLTPVFTEVVKSHPDLVLSVDCYHSTVVEALSKISPFIINDITGFSQDERLLDVIKDLGLAYVLMHIKGTPADMQSKAQYTDVVFEVISELSAKLHILKSKGINEVIVDPGFGFAKTTAQNYELLRKLNAFGVLGHPIMVGLSRKSMIYKPLQSDPSKALNGTTALHMAALLNGARILRVHDVKEAVETRILWTQLQSPS